MAGDAWRLEVFRRAYALSLEIHRVSGGFPKTEQYGGVAEQLRRASKSVCALLAEGSGRQQTSAAEFRRYAMMALGSVEEVELWCCCYAPRSRLCRYGAGRGLAGRLCRSGSHAAGPAPASFWKLASDN
jgi:four helix bundle protein